MAPFIIEEIEILHQIPFSPSAVAASSRASGIRAEVKIILIIDGGSVLPSPAKEPSVVISRHINSCDTPRILR